MVVRQDFNELPPKMFMMQITDTITKIYMFLWDRKDSYNQISISWKDLMTYHNKNSFRTNLRKLNTVGLLSYVESDCGVAIEMVSWDEIED